MSTGEIVLLCVLGVLNIPVYLFIAWLAFDNKEGAVDTIWETSVALARMILVPALIRRLLGWDDEGALGLFPIGGFLLACAGIVYGEFWLIMKMFGTG